MHYLGTVYVDKMDAGGGDYSPQRLTLVFFSFLFVHHQFILGRNYVANRLIYYSVSSQIVVLRTPGYVKGLQRILSWQITILRNS
jgi:hypothetical protein